MARVTVIDNVALDDGATNGATSTVGEPSVGVMGDQLFVTGNWYASASTDAGQTWTFVDPFTALPSAAGGFCCDQLTLHDHARGVWIWLLQYVEQDGANVFRLAATRDAAFPSGWYWWDIAPTTLDAGLTNLWFDYPEAALTTENLFVSFNLFNAAGEWQRAAVMRFPLQAIADGGNMGFSSWSTTENGSLRLVQGAQGTMYWGSHNSASQLRLFRWADGETQISWWDLDVEGWNGDIASTAPNGVNWLGRADARITAGTVAGGTITLMWTAGGDDVHPQPHCRVVRIGEADVQVRDQPHIWSDARAWAYPAAAPNDAGVIGFTAFYGGGDRPPGHVVGIRDDEAGAWRTTYGRQGGDSPEEPKWGDYLTCRAHAPKTDAWIATGFTLEGGQSRTDVLPRVVRFGLAGHDGPVAINRREHQ